MIDRLMTILLVWCMASLAPIILTLVMINESLAKVYAVYSLSIIALFGLYGLLRPQKHKNSEPAEFGAAENLEAKVTEI